MKPRQARQTEPSLVIYQVFPRFHSREGTLREVTADLTRIRDLGADVLYLMPIYPLGELNRIGKDGSPYCIRDHRQVDPALGGDKAFDELLTRAREVGLRVMLDIVFHHTAMDSHLVESHPDWYLRDEQGAHHRKVPEWSDIYDLDYRSNELWEHQIETLRGWRDRGVDGFRCDVAVMVPLEFWEAARTAVDPDRQMIWLAETGWTQFVKKDKDLGYAHHADPEMYSAFDLTYDNDGWEILHAYFEGRLGLSPWIERLRLQECYYPHHAPKMRWLESHDDPRLSRRLPDAAKRRNWFVAMAMLPGTLHLYAGQEIGEAGQPPDASGLPSYHAGRWVVQWEHPDAECARFTKAALRAMRKVKSEGTIFALSELRNGLLRLDHKAPSGQHVAIVNLEGRTGRWGDLPALAGRDLLSGAEVELRDSSPIPIEPLVIECKTNA
jgi:glycosidase